MYITHNNINILLGVEVSNFKVKDYYSYRIYYQQKHILAYYYS